MGETQFTREISGTIFENIEGGFYEIPLVSPGKTTPTGVNIEQNAITSFSAFESTGEGYSGSEPALAAQRLHTRVFMATQRRLVLEIAGSMHLTRYLATGPHGTFTPRMIVVAELC